MAKDTIKLLHQVLRVLYSDLEPGPIGSVDEKNFFAACNVISKN